MASMGAGKGRPADVIHLDRDKPEVDDELIARAKAFAARMNHLKN